MIDDSSRPTGAIVGLSLSLATFGLIVFIYCIFRLLLFVSYGQGEAGSDAHELFRCFLMGVRFDAKMASLTVAPLLLAGLAGGFFVRSGRSVRTLTRALVGWATTLVLVHAFLGAVNHFYYRNFNAPIDMRAFGLVDDGFFEVMASVWTDYPVVWSVAGLAFLGVGVAWLLSWFLVRTRSWRPRPFATVSLHGAWALLLALAARGTVTTFPLERDQLVVSERPFLNAATNNGAFALFLASEDYVRHRGSGSVKATLEEGALLAATAGLAGARATDFSLDVLERTTPWAPYLEKHPPHVVFVVSEAMSGELLLRPESRALVAGRLEPHLDEGFLFSRFVSARDGTFPSLEFLLFGAYTEAVSDSFSRYVPLQTAAHLPFKRAGYRTVFVTSGPGGWRNLADALPRQGFDAVVDKNAILSQYREARDGVWGVADAWMYKKIASLLSDADDRGEPLFIFALTTSNHSPFAFPEGWQVQPFSIPGFMAERLLVSEERGITLLKGQRCANDSLGDFLEALGKSAVGERTLVAVTGDHNLREGLGYGNVAHVALRHSVPFFLRIPPAYRNGVRYDAERPGGHKDVFATLYPRALSSQRYFSLGEDLLGKQDEKRFSGENEEVAFNREGAVVVRGPETLCLPWASEALLELGAPQAHLCETLAPLAERLKARNALYDWQIRFQVEAAQRGRAL